MRQFITIIAVLTLLLCSCTGNYRRMLNRADAVMEQEADDIFWHPADSAMSILKQIDRNQLSKGDLPYYALLMTQAQVKDRIPLTSDSLISLAYRKYDGDWWGDKGIRSNFFMGEVFFNQDKPREAMKYYLTAYEESKRLGNYYWLAQSAERISHLFLKAYNHADAVKYRKEAIEAYHNSNHPVCEARAESKLKSMFENDGKITECEQLQDSLFRIDYQHSTLDSLLLQYSNSHPMSSLIPITKMYGLDFLNDCLQNLLPDSEKLEGSLWIAKHLRLENKFRESDSIITSASEYATSNEEKIKILYALFENARLTNNPPRAFELADSIFHYQEAITNESMTEDLNGAHSDFYTQRSIKSSEQSRLYLGVAIVAIFVVLLIAFLSWRILRLRHRAHHAEMEAKIESLVSMKAYADKLLAEQFLLKKEFDEKSKEYNEESLRKGLLLESLLKDRWKTLNELCEEYYEKGTSKKIKDAITAKIETEIKNISSEEGLDTLIAEVNKYLDGIVDKLQNELPQLKKKDVAFCSLMFAGFSTKAICLILDIQSGNFYVKKGRIIKKISDSDAQHKEEFIARLK